MAAKNKLERGQSELNIGLIGHVDHGKTTLTKALSGKWTDTHSEEIRRGITIRLGYADFEIRKCGEEYTVSDKCADGKKSVIIRKASLIDAPGHESLMATMLAGTTIMDGALLLIAANESCPQPQTREHLMALQIAGVKNVVVVQNKVDLVSEEDAIKNYEQIKEFLKGTDYENSPIIPISAKHNVNIDVLLKSIEETIPVPKRDKKQTPLMFVARSFDINKPGTKPSKLVGGVLGGALVKGVFKVGDEIEIKPGRRVDKEGKPYYKALTTKIISLKSGGIEVKEAVPGGSMAVMTSLDPSIVKSDMLTGSAVGLKGKLPPLWNEFTLETTLLDRVVGVKENTTVDTIKTGEILMLNVNSAATVGIVNKISKDRFHCKLRLPICAEPGSRVTISRRVGDRFRLIGYGILKEEK